MDHEPSDRENNRRRRQEHFRARYISACHRAFADKSIHVEPAIQLDCPHIHLRMKKHPKSQQKVPKQVPELIRQHDKLIRQQKVPNECPN